MKSVAALSSFEIETIYLEISTLHRCTNVWKPNEYLMLDTTTVTERKSHYFV